MNRQPDPVGFGQVGRVAGVGEALVKLLVKAQAEAVVVSFCQCGVPGIYLARHAVPDFIDGGDRFSAPAISEPGRSSASWCNGGTLAEGPVTLLLGRSRSEMSGR